MKLKNFLDQGASLFRISPHQRDLEGLIQKIQNPRPAVLLLDSWGRHAFLKLGCSVFQQRDHLPDQPDIVCGQSSATDLIPSLQSWKQEVKRGGLILLFSWLYKFPRTQLAASFLHVGLSEVAQKKSGAMIITVGKAR